jgi:hypothetical protein
MKSLVESLFDTDLVQKKVPVHQIKDIAFFDGQWVLRLAPGFPIPKQDNALGVIDWKKVVKDVKEFGGQKIDLGMYAYANASNTNIRTVQSTKKTELFARLLMCIPFLEECRFGEFNSRFRDEMCQKLDQYILPEWKGEKRGINGNTKFHFDIITSKWTIAVCLTYGPYGNTDLLRWEFEKLKDD